MTSSAGPRLSRGAQNIEPGDTFYSMIIKTSECVPMTSHTLLYVSHMTKEMSLHENTNPIVFMAHSVHD